MNQLKAIIVDDEWLVRSEFKAMLSDYSDIIIVGEAGNVPQAIELIDELNPEVIFLDIQMPGETGFDLLERTDLNCRIVFITAYNQYAIRAFEVNALDYLLKPVSKERLSKTIQRLRVSQSESYQPANRVTYDDVIYLSVNGSLKFIKVSSLKCIVAEGNYSYIIYDNKKDLVTKTLREWGQILPEKYFVRIHRSMIVNFEYVVKVKKCKNYTHEVYVRDLDKPFIMSRRYAVRLKKMLCL